MANHPEKIPPKKEREEITNLDLKILWNQKERLEKLEKKLQEIKDKEEREKIEKEIQELKTDLKLREAMIKKELGG